MTSSGEKRILAAIVCQYSSIDSSPDLFSSLFLRGEVPFHSTAHLTSEVNHFLMGHWYVAISRNHNAEGFILITNNLLNYYR